jgi:hypothetical protein
MPRLNFNGKLSLLRVNNLNDRFGPMGDQITAEVIFRLASQPNRAFGVRLRDDANLAVGQGMLDLLRDAMRHGWVVNLDADVPNGKQNGIAVRVWLTQPQPSGSGTILDTIAGAVLTDGPA